jgi:DNA polymerase-3 subunit delta
MPGTIDAFAYLQNPAGWPPAGVCVLFGDDRFLKQLARREIKAALFGARQDEAIVSVFAGEVCQWRDVSDELATVSLFGAGEKRLAIVEDADKFVTANRSQLEDYAASPSRAGVLILDVESWAANTRLYKQVDKSGLQILCKPPEIKKGRDVVPDEVKIAKWLVPWAASRHDLKLARGAVEALLELVGAEIGMLDQALAKLSLYVDRQAGAAATPEMVHDIVGGWRAKSAFELIDTATMGDAADALVRLDRLLQSSEHPIAILAAISWSLRRFASAARHYARAERRGSRPTLRQALLDAGFKDWPAGSLAKNEERLKQITRLRAGRLHRWLLEADLELKGGHSSDDRARLMLEQLIFRLARETVNAR